MVNILLSINPDLASSIAIRYAGQLGKLVKVGIQPIHVREPEQEGSIFCTGWVRRTWENALLKKGEEDIRLLISAEKSSCPSLAPPRVIVGRRDNEILEELRTGTYDLFMEGVLASFDDRYFKRLFFSKLYLNIPCPILVVKNLAPLERISLLITEEMEVHRLVQAFWKLFGKSTVPLDIFFYSGQGESGDIQITEVNKQESGAIPINKLLHELEWSSDREYIVTGHPKKVGEYLGKYGIVGSAIRDRGMSKKNPVVTVLALTPAPILIC